ncbi:endonuclease domain-containing protein, partial [Patescibacteria group bacterium]
MYKKIFNNKLEKVKRQILRNNIPRAEEILWKKLRKKQLNGYKFRRQYSIDKYVVDFYCPEVRLAIEIDGDLHFTDDAIEKDKKRQHCIEKYNICFLRFCNVEVYRELNKVLEIILNSLLNHTTPEPP